MERERKEDFEIVKKYTVFGLYLNTVSDVLID
jgi:hypothetical protein